MLSELPKLGRLLGLYSGRSIGAIIRAKNELFDATNDNKLVQLQREFQRGIDELNEIRSELTSVGSMRRPLQPTSTPSGDVSSDPVKNATEFEPTSVAMSQAASSEGRSSVSLASTAAYRTHHEGDHSAEARLARAELQGAAHGQFRSRVERLEGGADYVAASILASLLLEQKKMKTHES
ncbi:hypothetical protein PsorP6_018014 [Peronosclerospora sorghi]|uniref:Uncharacterized protein n=1 Tax=Peronosclerospora sorghi TaxID=230839 RepID=A0ACC0WEW8_9STRA|nr:hypothetical protein PsorP6_018014 [Peronosclerospora sorghi]